MTSNIATDEELVFEIGDNRDLRKVTRSLRDGKVDLDGITTSPSGSRRTVRLLPSNVEKATGILDDEGIAFEQNRIVTVPFENQPADLDELVGQLEDAGIEADSIYPTMARKGGPTLALHVEDPDGAVEALQR